jgi:hypothetical protein
MTSILFTQSNPATLTAVHSVHNLVITPFTPPLPPGGLLTESGVVGQMSEFLFKMEKDGQIYWIGAAVPDGTSDFSKVQVFFHPTVVQRDARGPVVVAAEGDYPAFTGGWSGSLKRYVALQGGQLAAAPKQMALIVPFMTMAAFGGKAPAYMFATRPTDTLNAIMEAVQNAAVGGPNPPLQVARIGVTSFSSGIGAMRLFIGTFGKSGLIVETTDFDSPFIIGEPHIVTRSPTAVGRVFSQVAPPSPLPGWVTMPAPSFQNITGPLSVHNQIGSKTFLMASITSIV